MAVPEHRQRITAVLGPTNTGKTYLAIERMLGYRTGMIGFPLRLLARENYDRVVGIVGTRHVALVTGEEKIIPPTARYFLCTVESMPLARMVEYLAVDEVQLAADPERGHVFTDRILHARGTVETMFLGADTIRGIIRMLVPDAEFVTRPRFSQLSYSGPRKLTRLKRRSAVVAFSANDVYEIAEQVRRNRGGTAVVLGALSPRTRNAQVALYQEGAVDYLVATDAIGMGLNMDIDHVAFARLKKFDGARNRPLTVEEIAQIAGRAGRHMSDGTFGTLAELGPLAPETVDAIENHRFSPVRSVWWRNSDLDFRTLRALRNSLEVRPPLPVLRRVPEAEDHLALRHLAADAEIARLAGDPDGVRLLWEVCQIPDFRKTMIEAHNRLLGGIYRHLRQRDGRLPEDWVANQLSRLDRTDGDIDTLMARIAHVRTWTYIAHRADWLDDSAHWQDRARDVEDRLSDALHESLSQRFIDRRGAALARSRGKDRIEAELDSDGGVFVEGERVGRLDGLRFIADETASGTTRRLLAATATRALQGEVGRRVAEIVAAPDAEFDLADDGGILWRGARVGALAKGADILSPAVRIASTDLLAPAHRQRGEERLARWIAALLSGPFGTLCAFEGAGLSPPARGIAFQLREGLGTLSRRHARGQIAALDATDRKDLRALGVRIGVDAIFIPALVKPRAVRLRAILWVLWHDLAPIAPPAAGLVTVAADPEIPDGFYEAVGFSMHAGRAVRTDIADRLSVRLKRLARAGRFELPADLAPLLGLGNDETEAIVCAMGYRRVPDGTEFEPHPASRRHETRAARPRSRRGARGRQKPGDSPFAALAGLRRR